VYVVDSGNKRIRKVSNGVITTVAGNGMTGFSGDNGPATSAELNEPEASPRTPRATCISPTGKTTASAMVSNGVITTVAGNGTRGYSGDGGPATSAQLAYPQSVAVDLCRQPLHRRHFEQLHSQGRERVITTVAGNGEFGFSGDNGPATAPSSTSYRRRRFDSGGNLYIADQPNQRIRKVSNGLITTVAGGGNVHRR